MIYIIRLIPIDDNFDQVHDFKPLIKVLLPSYIGKNVISVSHNSLISLKNLGW